ncbi:MAG: hypothetical protein Q9169_004941 [Polycauliona sp. 2 TL-2023]
MAYRVELASTARAICKMTECKKEKVKIGKNELRYDILEGELEMLDGYDELPTDCQEKVKRALENGHVDDEDWKGDVEQNRPGMKGFRSPAAKKKKAEEQEVMSIFFSSCSIGVHFTCKLVAPLIQVLSKFQVGSLIGWFPSPNTPIYSYPSEDSQMVAQSMFARRLTILTLSLQQSDAQEGDQSPSKPLPKKRGRPKKEMSEEDGIEEPAQKKTKVTAKKGKKIKNEEEVDEVDMNEAKDVSGKANAKKGKQTKENDPESVVAAKPKAKASAKKAKAVKEEPVLDESDVAPAVPPKKSAAGKKGKKTVKDDGPEDPSDEQARPVKAGTRSRKAKVENVEEPTPASEHDEPTVTSTKKPRATKNAANTKKPIVQKTRKSVDAEAPVAEAPKAKRGRKKADS